MTEGGPAGGAQARGDQDRHRGHLPAHPRAEEARQGLSGKGQQDSLIDQVHEDPFVLIQSWVDFGLAIPQSA